MKNIVKFIKSEKFGHGLGVFLVLSFFFIVYAIVGTMEYNATFNN